jgi:hypothetical protein
VKRKWKIYEGGLQAVYFLPSAGKDISDWRAYTRYMWYQMLSFILENEEAQKRGNVGVVSGHGPWHFPLTQFLEWNYQASHILHDWPNRLRGLNLCYDSPAVDQMMSVALAMGGKTSRLHNRVHFGSPVEVQYSLRSYGIQLPQSASSTVLE